MAPVPPSMMKRACCRGAMSGCCRDLREGFFGSGLRPLMCSALASANASRALSDELVPTKWHASCFSPTSTCKDPNTYTSHLTEVASLAFHPVPPTSTYRMSYISRSTIAAPSALLATASFVLAKASCTQIQSPAGDFACDASLLSARNLQLQLQLEFNFE
jgi:hypothetical protein